MHARPHRDSDRARLPRSGRSRGAGALAASALALSLALGLSGCGAAGGSNASSAVGESSADSAAVVGPGYASDSSVGAPDAGSASAAADRAQSNDSSAIIVTGYMRLDVDGPAKTMEEAGRIVEDADGSVASTNLVTDSGAPYASATFKIPAETFEATREKLASLGRVSEQSTSSSDVGAEVADLDARIAALKASIERLTALIDKAETTAELIEAERELTDRQAELDGLNAQRAWYADRVSYSTLDVEFRSTSVVPAASGSAWERSWSMFLAGISGIAYALIMAAPWLLLFAPLVALAWWIGRRARGPKTPKRAPTDGDAGAGASEDVGLRPLPLDEDAAPPSSMEGPSEPAAQGHTLRSQGASEGDAPQPEETP